MINKTKNGKKMREPPERVLTFPVLGLISESVSRWLPAEPFPSPA